MNQSDDEDIVDVREFQSYAPVMMCGAAIAFIMTAVALAILSMTQAPKWISVTLMIFCVTTPFGGLLIRIWNKPAVRLPSGYVMRGVSCRLYAGLAWIVAILLIVLRMLTG